jgi:hypothetical protein
MTKNHGPDAIFIVRMNQAINLPGMVTVTKGTWARERLSL